MQASLRYWGICVVVTPEQKVKNVEAFESLIKVAAYGGGPILPLTEWCSLAPIHPTGGYWYFSFECPACRLVSPMFRDFSDGNLGNPFVNFGLVATCYFCKAIVRVGAVYIRSAQWPLEPSQKPPESEYANRLPRKYKDDPEQRPVSGPLHHYTSLDALRSIVKTKTLWATNVHYMHDTTESEFGLELMRQVAAEARKAAAGIDAEFLTVFLVWLDRRVFESASVYVLCFSEARDKLSQWRGFTTYGQGVCLSIDSVRLVERMQAYGWTFQHCRYNRISQLTWAESILSRMRRQAATARAGIDESNAERFDVVLQSNLSDLLQVAATLKDEAFADEREVRFISPMINGGDERIAYRLGKTASIPYVEFRLVEGEDDLAIHEIMLGPSPTQELTLSHITKIVRQNRIREPCIVSASRIPYREL